MLRKFLSLMIAVGMLSLLATSATAGIFLPKSSTFSIKFGGLPSIKVQGTYVNGGWATLSNNGSLHDLTDSTGIWATQGLAVGTSLLTGVGLIEGLTLTEINLAGNFTPSFSTPNPMGGELSPPSSTPSSGIFCPDGCLGGTEGFNGRFLLDLGAIGVGSMMLTSVIGVGGYATLMIGAATINVTAAPFITGKARITNVQTNVISLPDRGGVTGVGVTLDPAGSEEVKTFSTLGGFVSTPLFDGATSTQMTVVLSGTNMLVSASQGGQVTLISPLRLDAAPLGQPLLPGYVKKTFVFVPEPGTVLLLVSGAAGLVFIGRRRMKG